MKLLLKSLCAWLLVSSVGAVEVTFRNNGSNDVLLAFDVSAAQVARVPVGAVAVFESATVAPYVSFDSGATFEEMDVAAWSSASGDLVTITQLLSGVQITQKHSAWYHTAQGFGFGVGSLLFMTLSLRLVRKIFVHTPEL